MSLWVSALLFVVWLGIVIFLRYYRIWLLYYIVGASGCAYWLILVAGRILGLEPRLAYSVAWAVHVLSNSVGVPTRVFDSAPGVLLVLVIVQNIGWTVLQIGVESSGLLEISVLVSLLLFYPGWSPQRRIKTILLGIIATWVANVVRMIIIVIMLHMLGKEALVLAHTYMGKLVFFVLTIGIYWYLITLPTVHDLSHRWQPKRPAT